MALALTTITIIIDATRDRVMRTHVDKARGRR